MKKVFENKPKFFFLVEIILVVVAIIVAFAAGYIYKDATAVIDAPKNPEGISLSGVIAENKTVATTEGTVTKISESSVTIVTKSKKTVTLVLNESTSITKDDSADKITTKDVKINDKAVISYNIKDETALNIYITN